MTKDNSIKYDAEKHVPVWAYEELKADLEIQVANLKEGLRIARKERDALADQVDDLEAEMEERGNSILYWKAMAEKVGEWDMDGQWVSNLKGKLEHAEGGKDWWRKSSAHWKKRALDS